MTPGNIIFLLDESGGMGAVMRDTVADGTKSQKNNAQRVATALNALFNQLPVAVDCDLALVGYRTDRAGQLDVGSRWSGPLAGRDFVSLRELSLAPLRVETRTRKLPNPSGFGPAREEQVSFPVWYEPTLGDGAPQVAAYEACLKLIERGSGRMGEVGPPLVVHIQSGWASDGNPQLVAERLVALATAAGPPIVVQIHLANSSQGLSALYPSSAQYVTMVAGKDLFRRASPLPELFVTALKAAKAKVGSGARGMLYNAKIADVIQALTLVKAHVEPGGVVAAARPQGPHAATAEDVPAAITMDDLMKPKKPAASAGSNTGAAPVDDSVEPLPLPRPPYLSPLEAPPAPPSVAPPPSPLGQPNSSMLGQATPPSPLGAVTPPVGQSATPLGQPAPPIAPPIASGPVETYGAGAAWMPQEESWATHGGDEFVLKPLSPDEEKAETFVMRPDEMRTTSMSSGRTMLVVLVLDRSLEDPAGHNPRGPFARLQDHANDLLQQLAHFHDAPLDVSLISYGLTPSGQVEVRNSFEGAISDRAILPQTELEQWALRVEEFTDRVSNGVGGLVSVTRRKLVFCDLKPTPPTSPVPAFATAARLIKDWGEKHPLAFARPLVVHLTRGQGDPRMIDAALKSLAAVETSGGQVQLHHLIYTEAPHGSLAYPADDAQLTDPVLKLLCAASSPLVGAEELAAGLRPNITQFSRGFVVNGKFDLLLDGLREAAVR